MKTKFPNFEVQEKIKLYPSLSSYVCFAEVITTKDYLSQGVIKRNFEKWVETGDYARSEKNEILGYLYWLSREPKKETILQKKVEYT